MNKAENVPIATLSGIASLTEIAAEVPLPSSSSFPNQLSLFKTQEQKHEAVQLITHPRYQARYVAELLETVNNAYLDFKNSSYNRSSFLQEDPNLPPFLQQVIQDGDELFQPKFDTYHGSPLKTNAVSALAYSPNQRNVFLYQQQYKQNHQIHQQAHDYQQQQHQNSYISPLLKGDQISPLPIVQPGIMNQHNSIPPESSANMMSPKLDYPSSTNVSELFQKCEVVNQALNENQSSSQVPDQVVMSSFIPNNETEPIAKKLKSNTLEENQFENFEPILAEEEKNVLPQNESSIEEEDVAERSGQAMFSPIKTRNQRRPSISSNPQIDATKGTDKPDFVKGIINEPRPFEGIIKYVDQQKQTKHHKHKRKSKEKKHRRKSEGKISNIECRIDNANINGTLKIKYRLNQGHIESQPPVNQIDFQLDKGNILADDEAKLDLKVPKLILRKVKKNEGSNQVETLEVYSPEKTRPYIVNNSCNLNISIQTQNQNQYPISKDIEDHKKETVEQVQVPNYLTDHTKDLRKDQSKDCMKDQIKDHIKNQIKDHTKDQMEDHIQDQITIFKKENLIHSSKNHSKETIENLNQCDKELPVINQSKDIKVKISNSSAVNNVQLETSKLSQVRNVRVEISKISESKQQEWLMPNAVKNDNEKRRKDPSVWSNESNASKPEKRKRNTAIIDPESTNKEEEEEDEEEFYSAAKRNKTDEGDDGSRKDPKTEVRKFMFLMNKILDRELELDADGEIEINEDVDIPQEYLMPRSVISSLCTEMAKMKTSGMLLKIPTDQLVRIIAVMDRHVLDSRNLSIHQDESEEESKKWYSLQVERVLKSVEAGVTILLITTTPEMPKQILLEEAIDHVVSLCQFHLENTIYPEYDPIYKVTPGLKDSSFQMKNRRHSKNNGARNKLVIKIYNKLCELVSLVGDLISAESLTDHIILKMSQIGISPFFVENVNVLQLEALKIARIVFRNYLKHRDLILDDILASLTRLPSNKRNLRSFRLKGETCIQMFTALVLQLIQCTVQIKIDEEAKTESQNSIVDQDVLIVKSYEDSLRAAQNFMSIFLKKCSLKDENDYRPLFENFLHDLFAVVNYPEWPAAEVLLTQLGTLFVVTFSNTKLDMSLRSSSLDYLSQIATHLRKRGLKSKSTKEQEKLKLIIEKLINREGDDDIPVVEDMEIYEETLRKELITFLNSTSDGDDFLKYAREFYLGQWLRDVQIEIDKSLIAPMMSIPGAATKSKTTDQRNKEEELSDEKLQVLQEKKDYYHSLIKGNKIYSNIRSTYQLDYDSSCTVVDYLASSRSFSQSFDLYMQQIFKMLNEQAIGLRTKAVKALTMIVSVDPTILSREDVQKSVHSRLLDPSTNVREAAVDLIGHFILKCPDLINQYYEMIVDRILDTGVSVRKRVIKILRDICLEQPGYDKIPEICSKMIRRVDDEVGIKKLVTEVFRSMWFQPFIDVNKCTEELYIKAVNITKVVALNKDTGFEWLESLLKNVMDSDNGSLNITTKTACQQIVDCLFARLLNPKVDTEPSIIISCFITLYIFCKCHPKLLVLHGVTLHPYLSSKVSNATDSVIINYVSKILELIVPIMEHPNPNFLAELEEDTMKLMLKQSQNVVQSCASCLATIVNTVTLNYKFVMDGFMQFFTFLTLYKNEHQKRADNPSLKSKRPTLLRALFTIGLFCRYFDLDAQVVQNEKIEKFIDEGKTTSEQVFNTCMYFTDFDDDEITHKAILAIGFIGIRYPKYLLQEASLYLYQEILSSKNTSTKAKFIILKSLQNHLIEEENRLQFDEKLGELALRAKKKKEEESATKTTNIKEMGDVSSSTTSELIQILLKDIMNGFFSQEKQVRISALQVISIILRQGLIHPAQCVPYLIAISTDNEKLCHVKAEQCLNDLDSRYQGFIHMKAFQGVKMSYEIQKVIQKSNEGYICGYRETESKIALIYHVYSLVRSNKQYRRPFLLSLLKQMDGSKCCIDFLYFIGENLAYLNYSMQEEVLFLMHHIDTTVSVSGVAILQKFKELFRLSRKNRDSKGDTDYENYDSDEEDTELDIKVDEVELSKVVGTSFGCMLLLEIKQYLRKLYGVTDAKCQKYSPSEPSKAYEKVMARKVDLDFISEHKDLMFGVNKEYQAMVEYYLQFKYLIMVLDAEDLSDSEQEKSATTLKDQYESDSNKTEEEKSENRIEQQKEQTEPQHQDQQSKKYTEKLESGKQSQEKKSDKDSHSGKKDKENNNEKALIKSGKDVNQVNDVISSSPNVVLKAGLKIDIPVIPFIKIPTVIPKKNKKSNSQSRRSSRSTRGAVSYADHFDSN